MKKNCDRTATPAHTEHLANTLGDHIASSIPPEAQASSLLAQLVAQTPVAPRKAEGIAIGQVERLDADGTIRVAIPALGLSDLAARVFAPHALLPGQCVALGFEAADPLRPVVLGALLEPAPASAPLPPGPAFEVRVDTQHVILHAEQEIELRCGEAAILLSADGHIQLRGTYITSQASATQRILGGSVNVN